ncbi:MAG: FHA domain-containing protein [Herpetosiphonaceae bacterium]|nr:FHA domain-containing protein [Herpetosiphonaceae bacterium]
MSQSSISYAIEGNEPITVELRPGITTLGAARDNDIALVSPGVAEYHARLIYTADDCWVMSLDHPEGTLLNQVRLRPNARYPLRNGDTLRIGAYFVRYQQTPGDDDDLKKLVRDISGEGTAPRQPRALPPEVVSRLAQAGRTPGGPSSRLPARRLRGNQAPQRPELAWWTGERSSYLQHLPPIYQNDDFIGRFLLIFESILGPIEGMIDHIHYYFDPRLIPEALLSWLALWVDLALNENWPLEKRRALVANVTELYRWRGTRRGMIEYLRLYTDVTPQIIEPDPPEQPRREGALPPHVFKVILEVPDPATVDRKLVEAIIQADKPAHTSYVLEIRAIAGDAG